jgi:ABC-type nitrate/sulfonate/bicarbonate transport system substrate-binding protein
MTTRKKIRIYYRAPSHVPLWKVMEECGFLEKQGLEMDFGSLEGQRKRAAEGLKSGELDIVSGNHHNLYARTALNGDPYVHIAQSNNSWRENYLVMGSGIDGLQDLKGKRVAMDDYDGHTGLNVWLYLRQQGLEEGRNVELVTGAKRGVDDEEWECFYQTQADSFEPKPYPSLEAIRNVFALALKRDPEIAEFNPLALWDLHYLREIDDSGYINRLYAL